MHQAPARPQPGCCCHEDSEAAAGKPIPLLQELNVSEWEDEASLL